MFQNRSVLKSLLRNLWTSKSGGVLIYIAFGLPILMGAMALSIDIGRVFILNTEPKDFSVTAALASAAELDGRVGAMVAAEAAARTVISGIVVDQVVVSTLASLR